MLSYQTHAKHIHNSVMKPQEEKTLPHFPLPV